MLEPLLVFQKDLVAMLAAAELKAVASESLKERTSLDDMRDEIRNWNAIAEG